MSQFQMASRKRRQTSHDSYSDCSDAGPAPRSNNRPAKSSTAPRVPERSLTPDSASDSDDYPEEYADYLACPFWKHNPRRYAYVRDTCTTGWGFADCGKLTEHIRRVHTRSHGCVRCGHRFTNITKNKLDDAKANHHCKFEDGRFDPDSKLEPEWLSVQQEERYNKLTFPRGNSCESPQAVFEKIYRALWPEYAAQKGVPSHYHKPGPMQPTYKFEQQRLELLQQRNMLKQAEERIRQMEALMAKFQNQTLSGPPDARSSNTDQAGILPLPQAESQGRYLPSTLGAMLTDAVPPFEYALPKGVDSEGRDSGVGLLSEEGAADMMDKDLFFGSTTNSDLAWWTVPGVNDTPIYDWSDDLMEQ